MTSIMTQAVGGTALLAVLSPTSAAMAASTSVEEQTERITSQADQLYDSNQWKEALAYLEQYADSTNVEVLWRLARLCYKVSKSIKEATESTELLLMK